MSNPQNAAQIAARNIKKPVRRRPAGPGASNGSNMGRPVDLNSVPQFANPGASSSFGGGGGGMFGGAVQAPSAFNFSAPGGPSLSFGSPSPSFGSPAPEDPRADTTGEEAARRNKPFRIGESSPAPAAPFGNLFGSGAQSNNMNSTQNTLSGEAQSRNNPFQMMPSTTQSSQPSLGFSFGTTTSQEKPASNSFSFGQAAQPQTQTTGFTFGATPTQAKPTSNGFSFGQTAPQTHQASPFTFGNSPAVEKAAEKTANTPFQFGQPQAPAQPTTSTPFSFGAKSQAEQQPTTNQFSFGQTQTQQPAAPPSINFGSTPEPEKPSGNFFSFGQTPAVTSSMSFNSTPAPAPLSSNLFGKPTIEPSSPSPNLFGQSAQQPASTNVFAGLKTPNASASNLFGSMTSTKPTSNLFGNQPEQPTAPKSIFSAPQSNNSASCLFGNQAEKVTTPSLLFGNPQPNGSTPSLFGNKTETAGTGTGQIQFGSKPLENSPSKSLFENQSQLSQPTAELPEVRKESSAPSSLFAEKPSSSLFGEKPSTNLFSSQQSLFGKKDDSNSTISLFGNQSQNANIPNNLFGNLNQSPTKNEISPVEEQPSSEPDASNSSNFGTLFSAQPPRSPRPTPATLFKPTTSVSTNETDSPANAASIFAVDKSSNDNILPSIEQPSSEFASGPTETSLSMTPLSNGQPKELLSKATAHFSARPNLAALSSDPSKPFMNGMPGSEHNPKHPKDVETMGDVPEDLLAERTPSHFTPKQKLEFARAYRTRALNVSFTKHISSFPYDEDFLYAFEYYKKARARIIHSTSWGDDRIDSREKRKPDGEAYEDDNEPSPNKRSRPSEMEPSSNLPAIESSAEPQKSITGVAKPVEPESQLFTPPRKPSTFMQSTTPKVPATTPSASPAKQSVFTPSTALKAPGAISNPSPLKITSFPGGSTTPKAPAPSANFFTQQTTPLPAASTPSGKRKAKVQLTKNGSPDEEAESTAQKMPKLNGSTGSATSNIFKNIVEGPAPSDQGSPGKKILVPVSKVRTDDAPKVRTDDTPKRNPFAKLPGLGGSNSFTPAKPSPLGASKFGSTPNSALNQSPTKATPAASNLFSQKPSTTSNVFAQQDTATPIPTSSFEQKNKSAIATNSSLFKPAGAVATNSGQGNKDSNASNLFAPKPSTAGSSSTTAVNHPTFTLKPPAFGSGGPVNFLSQFGQKAGKDAAEVEAKAKAKAKAEEFDSDDSDADEAEWEANYKKKLEEKKKSTEEAAKTIKLASFAPGQGFKFSQPASAESSSAPSPAFGGMFVSADSSRVSSPGGASTTGSVFDDQTSKPPVTFSNIFGNLDKSKQHQADDDDETEDEDSVNADEQDEQVTQPNSNSGSGTPGTPVEEPSAGIPPTNKPANIFSFGSATTSGTSTPRGGNLLADRISKDADGKPIRQTTAEDKENAGPSMSQVNGDNPSPFSSFNKSTEKATNSPGDHTWKPDTPIKFGSSTTSPPSVNITAPSPTPVRYTTSLFGTTTPKAQASPFASVLGNSTTPKPTTPGLFGSTAPKPVASPFANLFGNSTPPKSTGLFGNSSNTSKPAGVGFVFGGPSASSSLLPSTAASDVTSRATTPGATTDGDSANESNDPDAEKHEQLDLLASGAGEEEEEVLHEVRSKAMKFIPAPEDGGKSEWLTKGLGPLKVLKHKETGSSRILLRADPSGKIVLNKGLLAGVSYTVTAKTVKVLAADDSGKGLETWVLQVKTAAAAEELAKLLEENKPKA